MQRCDSDCLQYCCEWFRYVCGYSWVKKHAQEENAVFFILTNSWQGITYSYPGGIDGKDSLWQPGFNKKRHFRLVSDHTHDVILLRPSAFQLTFEGIWVKRNDSAECESWNTLESTSPGKRWQDWLRAGVWLRVLQIEEVSESRQTEDNTIHVTAGCANQQSTWAQRFH